jgi:hypothetical protein
MARINWKRNWALGIDVAMREVVGGSVSAEHVALWKIKLSRLNEQTKSTNGRNIQPQVANRDQMARELLRAARRERTSYSGVS